MTVVPRRATILPGQVVELKALLTDEHGDAIQGITVAWKSNDESVASVSSFGNVMGRREGYAVITATASNQAQTSSIQVLARPPKPGTEP
jgi:uncharacterized protein YjdB